MCRLPLPPPTHHFPPFCHLPTPPLPRCHCHCHISQGRISEIELRLYLASSGLSSADVAKVVGLFKTLVRNDRTDFVTFWDFVTAYDWIAQAFKIYNVPA